MSIKGGYINGERVYVFEGFDRAWYFGIPDVPSTDAIVIKHNDLVRVLNGVLKNLEGDDPDFHSFYSLVDRFGLSGGNYFVPYAERINEAEIKFDDPERVKRATTRQLPMQKKIDTRFLKPVVIRGGLCTT